MTEHKSEHLVVERFPSDAFLRGLNKAVEKALDGMVGRIMADARRSLARQRNSRSMTREPSG